MRLPRNPKDISDVYPREKLATFLLIRFRLLSQFLHLGLSHHPLPELALNCLYRIGVTTDLASSNRLRVSDVDWVSLQVDLFPRPPPPQ